MAGWSALAFLLAGIGLLILARPAHADLDESADSSPASSAPVAGQPDPALVAAPDALVDAAASVVTPEPGTGAPTYLAAGCILMLGCVALAKARSANGIGIRGDTQAGSDRRAVKSNTLDISAGLASFVAGARLISVRTWEALCGLPVRVPTAVSTG